MDPPLGLSVGVRWSVPLSCPVVSRASRPGGNSTMNSSIPAAATSPSSGLGGGPIGSGCVLRMPAVDGQFDRETPVPPVPHAGPRYWRKVHFSKLGRALATMRSWWRCTPELTQTPPSSPRSSERHPPRTSLSRSPAGTADPGRRRADPGGGPGPRRRPVRRVGPARGRRGCDPRRP